MNPYYLIKEDENMKSITNYLLAPSSIYKSVTRGAVILTHIVCILLCIVVAIAETHPSQPSSSQPSLAASST